MKKLILLSLAFGFSSLSINAQTAGSDQDTEFLTPSTGGKFLRWYGYSGRSYFLQLSDPVDHLNQWFWSEIIEGGNDEDISFEVDGTADKGFFRLHYTDQIPGSGQTLETADFDGDGFSNLYEITPRPRPGGVPLGSTINVNIQTNPLDYDTDHDGLPDKWEEDHGLDPTDDGTRDPNNGPNGDPDGDGLINLHESWYGADPHNSDTDGDGLTDGDEASLYQSSPTYADSDFDGLDDGEEVTLYGTDPVNWDTDEDTLSDGDEVLIHLTDPLEMDSDGDWMWDDWELAQGLDPLDPADGLLDADNDGLANQLEFVYLDKGFDPFIANAAGFDWASDDDLDGYNVFQEFTIYLTNPRQSDTDGDGMNDGWEIRFGFNARVNNVISGPAVQLPTADPDGDGLTNQQESDLGTNPNDPDTDADGVNDGVEDTQGTNPNDPNDTLPPQNGTVTVNVTFGDHSGSHSEKYRVILTPLEGDTAGARVRTNRQFDSPQTDTFHLPKGAKYKIELTWNETNPKYRGSPKPDYDYTLEIDDSANGIVIDDQQGITGEHNESSPFFAQGKDAIIYVPLFEWVTPKESPVTAPDDIGDGKNEFIYNSAAPGVLTINLKIEVKPTGTSEITDRHGVKFSDRCAYSLPTITGSTFAWDAANPSGKATPDGAFLVATASYTTLPASNSDFGLKEAAFACDGQADVIPKGEFEIFFGKDDTNHPGGQVGSPNCFHYWKQFVPLRRIANLIYDNTISGYGGTVAPTRTTRISKRATEKNDETANQGLHAFNETLAHESHHIELWEGWWGVGGTPNGTDDTDGDGYPNSFENSDIGVIYGFDENDINDLYNQAANSSGFQYEEEECRDVEDGINASEFDGQDWSYGLTIKGKNQ